MMEDIEAKDCYFKHLQSCKRLKEGKRNKTGPISSSLTEGPQPVSKEKMTIGSKGKYVSKSSDDESKLFFPEGYRTRNLSSERTKSSPTMGIEKMTIGSKGKYVSKSSDEKSKLFFPERYRTRNLSSERTKRSPTMGIEEMTIRSESKYVRSLSESDAVIHPLMNEAQKTPRHLSFERTKSPNMATGSWRWCFENSSNFKNDAKKLLLEGSLPDHRLFQDICKTYDHSALPRDQSKVTFHFVDQAFRENQLCITIAELK